MCSTESYIKLRDTRLGRNFFFLDIGHWRETRTSYTQLAQFTRPTPCTTLQNSADSASATLRLSETQASIAMMHFGCDAASANEPLSVSVYARILDYCVWGCSKSRTNVQYNSPFPGTQYFKTIKDCSHLCCEEPVIMWGLLSSHGLARFPWERYGSLAGQRCPTDAL